MHGIDLHWLPENPRWAELLAQADARSPETADWAEWVALAQYRITALQTMQLDRRRARALLAAPQGAGAMPVRLAVLASSTIEHLLPALRVAGLRRAIPLDTYTPDYGQYAQELLNPASELHGFRPNVVLFALDAHHLLGSISLPSTAEEVTRALERQIDRLATQWQAARAAFGAQIIQNVPLPVFLPLLGNNEHRLPGSRAGAWRQFAAMLRARADAEAVDLVALDDRVAQDGLTPWHDPGALASRQAGNSSASCAPVRRSGGASDRGRAGSVAQMPGAGSR